MLKDKYEGLELDFCTCEMIEVKEFGISWQDHKTFYLPQTITLIVNKLSIHNPKNFLF